MNNKAKSVLQVIYMFKIYSWVQDAVNLATPYLFIFRALTKFSPIFVLGFLSFWFNWLQPSLQFVICLCLYDAFLTLIDLNHSALLADLALSEEERTNLNGYSSFFSAIGSTSVFVSYYFWDKEFLITFQTFCVCLAVFSLLGFVLSTSIMKHHFEKTTQSYLLATTDAR